MVLQLTSTFSEVRGTNMNRRVCPNPNMHLILEILTHFPVTSQVNELNIIRQSLYELEVQHSKIRGQYEDELNRLRNELVTVRQTVPSNAPQPPPLGPGGIGPPGTSGPPVAPGLPPNSVSFNDSYYGRDRERDRERERGEPRERERERLIDREREREMRDRDRERDKDRDRDRSIDHRDAKRLKMDGRDRERSVLERGGGGDRDGRDRERDRLDRDNRMKVDRQGKHSSYTLARSPPPHHIGYHHSFRSASPYLPSLDHNSPSIGPGTGTTKLPPPPVVPSASTPGPLGPGFPPGPNANGPYQTTNSLPPVNDPASVGSLVPLNGFPDDPDAVPEHLKKHGSDWFALWNPKAKRVLDVSLVHTLSHERFVPPSTFLFSAYLTVIIHSVWFAVYASLPMGNISQLGATDLPKSTILKLVPKQRMSSLLGQNRKWAHNPS